MKKFTLTITILTFFCSHIFGQQTIFDLISNAKSVKGIESIYDLDVFSYYNLDEYNTELQKTVFKKTAEYQSKLQELKKMKAEMLKTTYVVRLQNEFGDYNIKRKGFEFSMGENMGIGTSSARPPKSLYIGDENFVILKSLPTKQVAHPLLGKGVFDETLFLSMSEETGLEIENDRDNFCLFFFFTPIGKEKTTFKFLNSGDAWYNITKNCIKADKIRIVVANKTSGKICYDRSF